MTAGSVVLPALIVVPAAAAASAPLLRRSRRAVLLIGTAVVHLALVVGVWAAPGARAWAGWIADDALGRIVLTLLSVLFLAVAQYAAAYVQETDIRGPTFVSCLLAFLAAASLVALSHHFALMWIGMETTTLAVAPLIFQRRDRRSLEAVWKYLMLSSVGIALALLGIFFLSTAQPVGGVGNRPLIFDDMLANAARLDPAWLRAAFVFVAIGFGTKMGLAPLHSWKPDTYGEAPSLVGALMAGALTSCAFLALARVAAICFAAGIGSFARPALLAFGLVSLTIAAAFIVGQRDVKRLLAYSSVEHMGLLAVGLGVGGVGAYGAVLHALNNGLAKGLLFLAVGNTVLAFGSSTVDRMRGVLRRTPASGALLVIGLFAVTGSPPFGMFFSEFAIIRGTIGEEHPWIAAIVIALLTVIFVGLAATLLELVYATPDADGLAERTERRRLVVAPLVLAALTVMLGIYIPSPLASALADAAAVLGGHAP